jgi:hypothetical protein
MTFFSASDFRGMESGDWEYVADLANRKLQRDAKVVYGKVNHNDVIFEWSSFNYDLPETTHRALLICIEELPKKECEHEIHNTVAPILNGKAACWKCGVTIEPTGWKEAKP